jgi:hypothetical protein
MTIINIDSSNKYIKSDLKREIDFNTIMRNFNTLLASMDRSSKQKISQETSQLNYTLDQVNLIDIYSRIQILISTWNIFKDRSYVRPQIKTQ